MEKFASSVFTWLFLTVTVSPVAFAQEAPQRPSFSIEDGQLVLPGPITFEAGKDTLTSESLPVLDFIKAFLEEKSYITLLRIEVHTDSEGGGPEGQELTERRAMAVAKALVDRSVDCKRLLPVGFGANKPVASNESVEGRASNRRVEVRPAELRGKAIGGMPVDGGGKVAGDSCVK